MAITVTGRIERVEVVKTRLQPFIVARSGGPPDVTVLDVTLVTDAGKRYVFRTPGRKPGVATDWFDAAGLPRVALAETITARGTEVGRNGMTRRLNRVRRVFTQDAPPGPPQTVTLPTDIVSDAVDAYRDLMAAGKFKEARAAVYAAQKAIERQQAQLAAWLCRLEDDAAYIERKLR